jgi:hypothetical protein
MSTAVFVLVLLAAVPHLILGGSGVDRLVVQIPAWYRIGPVAFARYARVADMGNGYFLYPLLGISGPIFTWAALAVALLTGAGTRIWVPLAVASGLCVLHSLTTVQAAPTMMKVGRTEDRPELIAPLLDRFAWWSWPRAILQVLTAATLLWVLIAR